MPVKQHQNVGHEKHVPDLPGCIRAAKLDQLRHDIRDGINSGESTPWDPDEIQQEGRKIRAARANATPTI